MLKFFSGFNGEKIPHRIFGTITAIIFLFFFPACVATSPQGTSLEKELAEANKKIDEIYHRMSVIQFMVDDHERIIHRLNEKNRGGGQTQNAPGTELKSGKEDRMTAVGEQTPSLPDIAQESPESVEEIYNSGMTIYKAGNYKDSFFIFRSVAADYPDHDLADNALYWTGECLYAQKDFAKAIAVFKEVVEKYPGGGKVPDALLKAGYAYLSLDDRENGLIYFKKVISGYPFSSANSKAEEMLERIE